MKGEVKTKHEKIKKVRLLCLAVDNLLCYYGSWFSIARLVSALRFLAFKEKSPKHKVISAEAWHAVALALYVYLAPPIVFLNTIQYGFFAMFLGECTLLFGTLEVLHCVYDR